MRPTRVLAFCPVLSDIQCRHARVRQQVDSKSKELEKRKSMEVSGLRRRPVECEHHDSVSNSCESENTQLFVPAPATHGIQFGVLLVLGLLGGGTQPRLRALHVQGVAAVRCLSELAMRFSIPGRVTPMCVQACWLDWKTQQEVHCRVV